MKNIPHSTLPNFYGLPSKDPNTFLFEFDVLCNSYEYINDAQNMKLFPTTLKEASLQWFMGLARKSIQTWDDMKQKFLIKYQDYCKSRDAREEMCKMSTKEDETREDFLERFHYDLQRAKVWLDEDTQKTLFLKVIRK